MVRVKAPWRPSCPTTYPSGSPDGRCCYVVMSASEGDWTQRAGPAAADGDASQMRLHCRSAHFRTQRQPTKNRHRPKALGVTTIAGRRSTGIRCHHRMWSTHYQHSDGGLVTDGSNAVVDCRADAVVVAAAAVTGGWGLDGFAETIADVRGWQCRLRFRLTTADVVCRMGTLQGRTDCSWVDAVAVIAAAVAESAADGDGVAVADRNDRRMRMWANRFRSYCSDALNLQANVEYWEGDRSAKTRISDELQWTQVDTQKKQSAVEDGIYRKTKCSNMRIRYTKTSRTIMPRQLYIWYGTNGWKISTSKLEWTLWRKFLRREKHNDRRYILNCWI